MIIQQSFKNNSKTLYVIPTPIGNLGDITYRSVDVLKNEIDILLCEDTRKTGILLKHYDIKCKMIAYHEHNKETMNQKVLSLFNNTDKIGLVSDAGMPGISDPGFELIGFCHTQNINVVVLPGASAFLLGIVGSNLPNNEFCYSGFLKGSSNERIKQLELIMARSITSVIYESTHKILKTLSNICEIDANRKISVGRELTKLNEEHITGTAMEVLSFYESAVTKGEFIITIGPGQDKNNWTIAEEYDELISQGMSKKDVIKHIAKSRKLKKNEVYMMFVEENDVD